MKKTKLLSLIVKHVFQVNTVQQNLSFYLKEIVIQDTTVEKDQSLKLHWYMKIHQIFLSLSLDLVQLVIIVLKVLLNLLNVLLVPLIL